MFRSAYLDGMMSDTLSLSLTFALHFMAFSLASSSGTVQGGPSGRVQPFVDFEIRALG